MTDTGPQSAEDEAPGLLSEGSAGATALSTSSTCISNLMSSNRVIHLEFGKTVEAVQYGVTMSWYELCEVIFEVFRSAKPAAFGDLASDLDPTHWSLMFKDLNSVFVSRDCLRDQGRYRIQFLHKPTFTVFDGAAIEQEEAMPADVADISERAQDLFGHIYNQPTPQRRPGVWRDEKSPPGSLGGAEFETNGCNICVFPGCGGRDDVENVATKNKKPRLELCPISPMHSAATDKPPPRLPPAQTELSGATGKKCSANLGHEDITGAPSPEDKAAAAEAEAEAASGDGATSDQEAWQVSEKGGVTMLHRRAADGRVLIKVDFDRSFPRLPLVPLDESGLRASSAAGPRVSTRPRRASHACREAIYLNWMSDCESPVLVRREEEIKTGRQTRKAQELKSPEDSRRLSGTDKRLSGTDKRLSGADKRLSGADKGLSGTDKGLSGTDRMSPALARKQTCS